MRLQTLKLSGFKSFAEPTVFHLPGQLVGVVGPNGCGKSNIMDAVRWVLGESKASELRGESMQDVIFNGSQQRKPASRASVELVFDNADHRAGGSWARYTEIAVKRVLTRDGNSHYYINQQLVRRRDVQDVFLGTGLGPRAYAIIGQGTIGRIIESRPEELRLFLEEAAGVSKYKERRRETAHRLQDARDNLLRVEDIVRELTDRLDKLAQQAEVATRYHRLQTQVGLRQQQLWWLRRRDADSELHQVRQVGLDALKQLEACMADLRRVQVEALALREVQHGAAQALQQAQARWYEANATVARLEGEQRHLAENRQRWEQRCQQVQTQQQEWQERQALAQTEWGLLCEQHQGASEQAEELAAQVEEQSMALSEAETQVEQRRQVLQTERQRLTEAQQALQVLAAQQRGLSDQLRQLQARRDRLSQEHAQCQWPAQARWDGLQQALLAKRAEAEQAVLALSGLQQQQEALVKRRDSAQADVLREAKWAADLAARLQALQALQARVKASGRLPPWLQRHGLDGLAALWTRLRVEPGWETALEAALQERMTALEITDWARLLPLVADPPPAKLVFFHALPPSAAPVPAVIESLPGAAPLLARVHGADPTLQAHLGRWLHGCTGVPDWDTAWAARADLPHGQSLWTPQGHRLERDGVVFYAPQGEQSGLLARAQEIENLDRQNRAQNCLLQEAQQAFERLDAELQRLLASLQAQREHTQQSQADLHALEVEAVRLEQQRRQVEQRREQLASELAEWDEQIAVLQAQQWDLDEQAQDLVLASQQQQTAHTDAERLALLAERQLSEHREQVRTLERQAQEAVFAVRSLSARRLECERTLDMARQQHQTLAQEWQLLQTEQDRWQDATTAQDLQQALAERVAGEAAVALLREQHERVSQDLRSAETQQQSHEAALEPWRQRITEAQLKEQAATLAVAQWAQALSDAGADEAAVATSIALEGVRLHGLPAEIERAQRDIVALGAVNLAALDELTAAQERKTFLDAQTQDLLQAITTLEDAIRKIDGETRQLLAQTFDTVNGHFGRMFPELFGGGQARLLMSGDDILDAGVQVMAQPPGKKNQTIHLLSGGEKALTAIALVFAIFQLNPAPFCLLDEVDAPLDDSNTERYARLVARMSTDTQFLFISHNKIAMEMAKQLIGVTMQEQGVSRIVAVDMQTAATMVEAQTA